MSSFIYARYGDPVNVKIVESNEGEVKDSVYRFLDQNGNGTGAKNGNQNHAGAIQSYRIQPEPGEIIRLERMLVSIGDTAGFSAAKYADIAALTNGIVVQTSRNGIQTLDLTDGEPIKTNADWSARCYDADLKTWGVGDELLPVRWTFIKSGAPLRLVGNELDSFDILLNDDFSGLTKHQFFVNGYYE